MIQQYIPYETLAREEARDIMESMPSALGSLSSEQLVAVTELIADAHAKGIEMGFKLSDFAGLDPGTVMEAYNAGIEEGKRDRGQGV